MFPWCSTHEDFPIDEPITNVGLIKYNQSIMRYLTDY